MEFIYTNNFKEYVSLFFFAVRASLLTLNDIQAHIFFYIQNLNLFAIKFICCIGTILNNIKSFKTY